MNPSKEPEPVITFEQNCTQCESIVIHVIKGKALAAHVEKSADEKTIEKFDTDGLNGKPGEKLKIFSPTLFGVKEGLILCGGSKSKKGQAK